MKHMYWNVQIVVSFLVEKKQRILRTGDKFVSKSVKKKIRLGQDTVNVYAGIQLKPLGPIKTQFYAACSLETLSSMMPEEFQLVKLNDDSVVYELRTSYTVNGNNVRKIVFFNNDYTFHVFIGEKKVDLKELCISNSFELCEESVRVVCTLVHKMRLCVGVKVTQSTICSRYHNVETVKDIGSGISTRQLRSVLCSKVLYYNSRSGTCKVCQKMTFNSKPNNSGNNMNNAKEATKEDFKKLIPNASEEMLELLISQSRNAGLNPKSRRWSKEMITACLQIYNRSPQVYSMIRDSNMLVLPSTRHLINYKTKIRHSVGFNQEVFRWKHAEANRLNLSEEAYVGGILIDEMAIQQDLQISKNGDCIELVWLQDTGEEGNICEILRKGKKESILSSHVLQLMFLGVNGFRFPFAHFLTTNVQAHELYVLFWEAVQHLKMYDFTTTYVSIDGAQSNRTFMHINIGKSPETMTSLNPSPYDSSIVFLMDPSHVVKKIRNNIIKSGLKRAALEI